MVACRAARDAGHAPPFRLRPGLVAEVLRFYDALGRYQKDVDTFERLALGLLEPGAADDRGAERLVRQTRFLAAAFRELESRQAAAGADEHVLRARLVQVAGAASVAPRRRGGGRPVERSLRPVAGRLGPAGAAARARASRRRGHRRDARRRPARAAAPSAARHRRGARPTPDDSVAPNRSCRCRRAARSCTWRAIARRKWPASRAASRRRCGRGALARLDRAALVVRTPLPYVYVTREVLRSAGVPCQMFDALPLAAESWAAAFDLVCSAVGTGFARGPAIALLGSPHFRFERRRRAAGARRRRRRSTGRSPSTAISASFRRCRRWSTVVGRNRRVERPSACGSVRARAGAGAAGHASSSRCAPRPGWRITCDVLLAFLTGHEAAPGPDDPLRARQLRARGALLGTLAALRDAYAPLRSVAGGLRRHGRRVPALDRGADLRAAHGRGGRAPARQRQRPLRRLRRGAAGGPGRGRMAGPLAAQHLLFALGAARAGLALRSAAARRRARRVRRSAAAAATAPHRLHLCARIRRAGQRVVAARRAGARRSRRGGSLAAGRAACSSTRRSGSTRWTSARSAAGPRAWAALRLAARAATSRASAAPPRAIRRGSTR